MTVTPADPVDLVAYVAAAGDGAPRLRNVAVTERRRPPHPVVVRMGLVAIAALVAACGGDGGSRPATPLPSPAVDGLHLAADVDVEAGDDPRVDVDLSVRLDADAGRSIEIPGLTTASWPPGDEGDPALLAHRGRAVDGGVVLSVGRGRLEDAEPGPPRRDEPGPRLIRPGDAVEVEARVVTGWWGDDAPEPATAEDLAGATVVRVCLWGVPRAPASTVEVVGEWPSTERLACVDVDVDRDG